MSAGVIGYVGRLRAALAPDADDAALLRAYATSRDADAFAALVRRHGPRVWATCRRVVGDPHAAEDAFQATFLVLARKAAGLSAAHSLAGWLHAVAVNVSVRARTAADRRKRREVTGDAEAVAPTPPEPADERALAALDEELAKLPTKLRDAVVLCELDGLSRREAADRLGVPEGTLSSRLAAARKRLADRLTGRGVGPEVLAVPAAAVPAGLAEAASGLGVGAVPAPAVLALAGGTMRAMLLKGLAAGAVACGLLAVGGLAKDEPPAKPAEPPKAVKPAAGPNTITLREGNQYVVLTPDGKRVRDERFVVSQGRTARVSPDGKLIAFSEQAELPTDPHGNYRRNLLVAAAGGEHIEASYRVNAFAPFWAADGRTLVAAEQTPATDPADRAWLSYRIDPATKAVKPLRLPRQFQPLGERPGGGWVGTWHEPAGPDRDENHYLATVAGPDAPPVKLVELTTRGAEVRLSSDGSKALLLNYDPTEPAPPKGVWRLPRLFVYDLVAGKSGHLPGVPADAYLVGYCWSPDGKQVAYTWKRATPGVTFSLSIETINDPRHKNKTDAFLTVMDADGGNRKDIRTAKGDPGSTVNLAELDWR